MPFPYWSCSRRSDRGRIAASERLSQGFLRFLNNGGKCCLFVHSEVCQDFTVDLDAGLAHAGDQTAVGQAQLTGTRVDTGNPERAELTLALTTVTVRILAGFDDGLLGNAINAAAGSVVTLGQIQNFLVAAACRNSTFYTRHRFNPLSRYF